MRSFCLASGSSGNSWFIETEKLKILVDIGLTYQRTKELLFEREIDIREIDYVFITHEHLDHILGLEKFLKNVNSKVFLSRGTYDSLDKSIFKNNVDIEFISHHSNLNIADLRVFVWGKKHDAKEALGLIFENGNKLGIFTDMGFFDDEFLHLFKSLDIVYLEANYCEEFLKKNSKNFNYAYLNRLMSDSGHLGLSQTCNIIEEAGRDGQTIILSHISENTNTYEGAYRKVKDLIESMNKDIRLEVSFQGESSDWF
jgi:phosphoribosyl 1,2-cyclic phosphodiesterase